MLNVSRHSIAPNKSEYDNKLNELYKQINKLRDEYFKI